MSGTRRSDPDGAEADAIVIGTLGRPHGIRGELRAVPTGPTLAALAPGAVVDVTLPDGTVRALTLTALRSGSGALLVCFREASDRTEAAALTRGVLRVDSGALGTLSDPDEFYVRDLLGCAVVLVPGDRPLGRVTGVHEGAANDSLEVTDDAQVVTLVPFTHDAVVAFDRETRRMAVRADLFGGGDV